MVTEYSDINYIDDLYCYIMELSHYIRNQKNHLSIDTLNEMMSYTFTILNLLQQCLDDKYSDY